MKPWYKAIDPFEYEAEIKKLLIREKGSIKVIILDDLPWLSRTVYYVTKKNMQASKSHLTTLKAYWVDIDSFIMTG